MMMNLYLKKFKSKMNNQKQINKLNKNFKKRQFRNKNKLNKRNNRRKKMKNNQKIKL